MRFSHAYGQSPDAQQCPFCSQRHTTVMWCDPEHRTRQIGCENCGARGPVVSVGNVAVAWNARGWFDAGPDRDGRDEGALRAAGFSYEAIGMIMVDPEARGVIHA